MTRALAALLAISALALACAHDAPPTALPGANPPGLPEPDARLLLIGDAGVASKVQIDALDWAKNRFLDESAPTAVVFLGDNFYPERTEGNLADVLGRQREGVANPDSVTFVPGNHDWHKHGARLFNRFSRDRIDRISGASAHQWRPAAGELGPEVVSFPHDLFRVIAIDSERWRIAAGACDRRATHCAALHLAEQQLTKELDCTSCAPAVVVAHHPLQTVGEHGGCGLSWLRKATKIGGQDVSARPYQAYVASLTRALAEHRPLLFAAGHDHSLQFARDPAFGAHIVSGAGAKRTAVCPPAGASWSRLGFMAVDFRRGAAPLLRVFAVADDRGLREVLREPLAR